MSEKNIKQLMSEIQAQIVDKEHTPKKPTPDAIKAKIKRSQEFIDKYLKEEDTGMSPGEPLYVKGVKEDGCINMLVQGAADDGEYELHVDVPATESDIEVMMWEPYAGPYYYLFPNTETFLEALADLCVRKILTMRWEEYQTHED